MIQTDYYLTGKTLSGQEIEKWRYLTNLCKAYGFSYPTLCRKKEFPFTWQGVTFHQVEFQDPPFKNKALDKINQKRISEKVKRLTATVNDFEIIPTANKKPGQ
jgi:hypothetical protein